MTIKILNETYTSIGTNEYGWNIGTVEVDLGRGRIVTAKAHCDGGRVDVAGFVGRYVKGNKTWIAHVGGYGEQVWASFGRDDRSGRFNKMQGISWEPETYHKLCNAKCWIPVEG